MTTQADRLDRAELDRRATSAGMSRRRFLAIAAATGGAAVATVGGLGLAGLLAPGQPGLLLASGRASPARFRARLPIPPVATPTRSDGTTDYYEITQRVAPLRIFDDVTTPAWTYGGTFPGPTIVSRAGRETVVTHRNELAHPVVVHLHGGHTPHDSDGYPTDFVLPTGVTTAAMPDMGMPGTVVTGQRDYVYPMNQRAATLWYHDHRMDFTGPGVWFGLAGFHLVHDDEEAALPLPTGDRDVPLMIVDRSFDAAGRLAYPSLDPALVRPGVTARFRDGVLGDVILVNGAPWPVLPVDRARYRLRLLNASNARRYRLVLDPPAPFHQIGSDGGLLDRPVTHDAVEMASGERFDALVDFAGYPAGTEVTLRNTLGSGPTADVMRFIVGSGAPAGDPPIPATLAALPPADPSRARVTRNFLFQSASDGGWTINGETFRAGRSLAAPTLGQPEVWRFTSDVQHPVHLHLDHFRVIARGNSGPGAYDTGLKDTVDLSPSQSVAVLVTFNDYAGRYVLHCHNLEHEDMAMMADFVTV